VCLPAPGLDRAVFLADVGSVPCNRFFQYRDGAMGLVLAAALYPSGTEYSICVIIAHNFPLTFEYIIAMTNFITEVAKRRTFAIISHPDAGKTTITEKLLLWGNA